MITAFGDYCKRGSCVRVDNNGMYITLYTHCISCVQSVLCILGENPRIQDSTGNVVHLVQTTTNELYYVYLVPFITGVKIRHHQYNLFYRIEFYVLYSAYTVYRISLIVCTDILYTVYYTVQGCCLRHVDHGMYNTASPFLHIPAPSPEKENSCICSASVVHSTLQKQLLQYAQYIVQLGDKSTAVITQCTMYAEDACAVGTDTSRTTSTE